MEEGCGYIGGYKEDLGSDRSILLLDCGGNYMTLRVFKLGTIHPPKKRVNFTIC